MGGNQQPTTMMQKATDVRFYTLIVDGTQTRKRELPQKTPGVSPPIMYNTTHAALWDAPIN